MEHSWIGNNFVEAVEFLLLEGSRWDLSRIVWAGDYADNEEDGINLYTKVYDQGSELKSHGLIQAVPADHHFICNYDTKQYVDKRKIRDNKGWRIHPLSLLTCDGNGRGGGDYRGGDEIVGSWSRNRIGVRNYVPQGFEELTFNLYES